IGSGRSTYQKGRIDATALEVDAIEDSLPILLEHGIRVAVKLERKAGVIFDSETQPQAGRHLIKNAPTKTMALVLRSGQVRSKLRDGVGSIVAQEQSTGDREPDVADHLGIAQIA